MVLNYLIPLTKVEFAYPTRPLVKIFKGLTFEVQQGRNVAIVGPSGGGKSTISTSKVISMLTKGSLLLRFYNPTSGRITLNGVDVQEYSVKQVGHFERGLTVVPSTYICRTTGASTVLWDFGGEYRVW